LNTCTQGCANGVGTSADNGSLGSPYIFAANVFIIDASALNIKVVDVGSGNPTLAGVYFKAGSSIDLFGFSVAGSSVAVVLPTQVVTGSTIDGNGILTSITVAIQALPTQANLYPGSATITCVTPNTNGVVHASPISGAGIPAATTCTVVDAQTLLLSNAIPAGGSPSYAAISVALPVAIPASGDVLFSPCLFTTTLNQGAFRECGGIRPAFSGGAITAEDTWVDVTSRFASAAFSLDFSQTITTVNAFTSGSGTSTGTDDSTEVVSVTASGSGSATAATSPSAPLFQPVVPAYGSFRVYKCSLCCDACFYLFLFNGNPFGGPGSSSFGLTATASATATASFSRTTVETSSSGGSTTVDTAVHATTEGGSIAVNLDFAVYDYGLSCFPWGQTTGNANLQGYAASTGEVFETRRSITGGGTETQTITVNGTQTYYNVGSIAYAGVGIPSVSASAGVQFNSCTPIGSNGATTTTTVEVDTTYSPTDRVVVTTTTVNSEPPTVTTVTIPGFVNNGTSKKTTVTVITVGVDIS
jgi:hypothetical protein